MGRWEVISLRPGPKAAHRQNCATSTRFYTMRYALPPQSGTRKPQPAPRNAHHATRTTQRAPRTPQLAPRTPQPATRTPHPATRSPQPAPRNPSLRGFAGNLAYPGIAVFNESGQAFSSLGMRDLPQRKGRGRPYPGVMIFTNGKRSSGQ